MERTRHSRSAGRSRREERRSGSIRSSHESIAGNLSPGRHHGRGGREGGFFKSLFGGNRRDKRQQQEQQEHFQQQQQQSQYNQLSTEGSPPPSIPPPGAPRSKSPSRFKQLLSFSPHSPSRHASPTPTRGQREAPAVDDMALKDMQHRMQLLQAQVADYDRLKAQLAVEQRSAAEWKEKWNYQNLKLNLMVDMLVLRVLELEQPASAGAAR